MCWKADERTVSDSDDRDGSPNERAAVGRELEEDVVPSLNCVLCMCKPSSGSAQPSAHTVVAQGKEVAGTVPAM